MPKFKVDSTRFEYITLFRLKYLRYAYNEFENDNKSMLLGRKIPIHSELNSYHSRFTVKMSNLSNRFFKFLYITVRLLQHVINMVIFKCLLVILRSLLFIFSKKKKNTLIRLCTNICHTVCNRTRFTSTGARLQAENRSTVSRTFRKCSPSYTAPLIVRVRRHFLSLSTHCAAASLSAIVPKSPNVCLASNYGLRTIQTRNGVLVNVCEICHPGGHVPSKSDPFPGEVFKAGPDRSRLFLV